ncbi:MAG: type II methionyl aminopeptidase [Thermoprotei archaeon]
MSTSDYEPLEAYLKAGEIAYKVKKYVASVVKPSAKLFDLAEKIEELIRFFGGEPAFPVNISVNEIAAHDTPYIGDTRILTEDSLVKVDIGVHVNGFIADTALTIALSDKSSKLVEATEEALHKALASVGAGAPINLIGKAVEAVAKKYGFNVVKNLTGHSLDRYLIHAGEVIPNYFSRLALGRLSNGKAYAIEPFLTLGKGYVEEVKTSTYIYALNTGFRHGKVTEEEALLVRSIYEKFKTLPICERWLAREFNDLSKLRTLLQELVRKSVLVAYPVLREISSGLVAQFEETILVSGGRVIITTNPELNK